MRVGHLFAITESAIVEEIRLIRIELDGGCEILSRFIELPAIVVQNATIVIDSGVVWPMDQRLGIIKESLSQFADLCEEKAACRLVL